MDILSNINEAILEMIEKDQVDSFLQEFKKGLSVELEHSESVKDDIVTVARIVLDHLEESLDYYNQLQKAESDF